MKKLLYSLLFLLACNLSLKVQAQTCTVDAGLAQTVCSSQSLVTLNGAANDYTSWTTSGTGFFDDAYSLTATYYPSPDDLTAGNVTLTLTNEASTCTGGAISDQVVMTFLASPVLSASTTDVEMCASQASTLGVSLMGQHSGATSFTWTTTGTGTFVPNATEINNNYTPSSADLISGSMSFTATAVAANTCNSVINVSVRIIPAPTLVNTTDYSLCTSDVVANGGIYLYPPPYATTTDVNDVVWTTTGAGRLDDHPINFGAWYYPTATELTSASLTFTATGTGECGTASDQLIITLDKPITIDPIDDQYLCLGSGATSVTFTAAITNTTSVQWYTSGSGTFSDANAATTTYTLSASELASGGGIYFQVDAVTTGACYNNTEHTALYPINALTVDAGSAITVCALQNLVTSSAYTNGTSSVSWSSNGTGTWINQNKVEATYIPSAADRLSGSGTLTLTGSGVCPTLTSTVDVTYDPTQVSVDAGGLYTTTCLDTYDPVTNGYARITLNGSFIGLPGATPTSWYVISGYGYTIDPYSAVTDYIASHYDYEYSPVKIVISGYDATCGLVSDTAEIVLNAPPAPDEYLESNNPEFGVCKGDTIYLGAYYNTQSVSWTASGGTGHFVGSTTDNEEAIYVAGINDQSITFTATYVALAGCTNGSATHKANIHPNPVAIAGSDELLCFPTNTLQLNANAPAPGIPPSEDQYGYWYAPSIITDGPAQARTEGETQRQGYVSFDDAYIPDAIATFQPQTTNEVIWRLSQSWEDMMISDGYYACVHSDTIIVTYLAYPDIMEDTLTAMAGVPVTKNLLTNDELWGQSYTVFLSDTGDFRLTNTATFVPSTGVLTYLNRSSLLNGRDTLRYNMTMPGCGNTDALVIVKLVNGAPFLPDTAKASTRVQKVNNVVTTLPLNLALVVADYNDNIDWSTLVYPTTSALSGANITRNPAFPYLLTLTYRSDWAQEFTGQDVINFTVYDHLGARYTGKYFVELVPDYEHPSVAPEDFVVINAISPNGDGVNDVLKIYGVAGYYNTVVIYNRWSQKVWEDENYDNVNVKFEGIGNQKGLEGPLPEGTYFYVVKHEGSELDGVKKGLDSGYIELRR